MTSSTTALGVRSCHLDAQADTPRIGDLRVGDPAPDFSLSDGSGEPITLGSFRGSPIVLVFQPQHWDPTAADHVASYNRLIAQLTGPAVFVIDGDGTIRWLHRADDTFAHPDDVARALAALIAPEANEAQSSSPDEVHNERPAHHSE